MGGYKLTCIDVDNEVDPPKTSNLNALEPGCIQVFLGLFLELRRSRFYQHESGDSFLFFFFQESHVLRFSSKNPTFKRNFRASRDSRMRVSFEL